jgi:hypothetical protein
MTSLRYSVSAWAGVRSGAAAAGVVGTTEVVPFQICTSGTLAPTSLSSIPVIGNDGIANAGHGQKADSSPLKRVRNDKVVGWSEDRKEVPRKAVETEILGSSPPRRFTRWLRLGLPRLRSGFRLQARTPAEHLNFGPRDSHPSKTAKGGAAALRMTSR